MCLYNIQSENPIKKKIYIRSIFPFVFSTYLCNYRQFHKTSPSKLQCIYKPDFGKVLWNRLYQKSRLSFSKCPGANGINIPFLVACFKIVAILTSLYILRNFRVYCAHEFNYWWLKGTIKKSVLTKLDRHPPPSLVW